MNNDEDFCIDAYVEGEQFDPRAVPRELDLFATTPEELAVAWNWRWQPGQELRISFLDGSRTLHRQVEHYARTWLDHANLAFSFGNYPDPEIRISFRGAGASSLVGTQAMSQPRDLPTMRLGRLAGQSEKRNRRTVLHEFGHAIGCIHEQASPASSIPWDEAKVYYEFRKLGWSDERIYNNILVRYSNQGYRFSAYDPKSIMQYPISSRWTRNGFEVGWNTDLSKLDKSFISRVYPR
ncbi:hypothetical protein [Amycolatopsis sp. NBC_00438]|uniref:hypothetical protein n=1 Tax=Amycolatopsis sp. NBC_00438 TaxID=2903558 RepID=UPI002E238600